MMFFPFRLRNTTPNFALFVLTAQFVSSRGRVVNSPRFGTKTKYHVPEHPVPGTIATSTSLSREMHSPVTGSESGCKTIHINAVIRHGIRNPGKSDLRSFYELLELEDLNDIVSTSDNVHKSLMQLKNAFQGKAPKALLPEGEKEQLALAQRLIIQYPFLGSLKEDDFLFISSSVSRTIASCSAFQQGLFPHYVASQVNDDHMRFFDICKKYLHEIENSEEALKEYHVFKRTAYAAAAEKVEASLNLLPGSTSLKSNH